MRGVLSGTCLLAAVTFTLVVAPSRARAQVPAPVAAPSDPRADFVSGNVVTCAGAGILPAQGVTIVQVGAPLNNSAADVNVWGTVSPHPGGGEEVNATILGPNVVIDTVVVKGGDGYNIYSNPAVLPPALAPPQRYISPLVGSGNVPRISHWFICYHETTPLPKGSLQVVKQVQAPDGVPVTPLPTSFTALVNCIGTSRPSERHDQLRTRRWAVIDPRPRWDSDRDRLHRCRAIPRHRRGGQLHPRWCQLAGSDHQLWRWDGRLHHQRLLQRPGATRHHPLREDPRTWPPRRGTTTNVTVEVACDDSARELVTLPGTGGGGTPDVSVRTLSVCALAEDGTSLPVGWTVTYSLNGGPPSATAPQVPVGDSSTQTVTITNDATAVPPPSSTTTIAGTTPTTAAATTVANPTTTLVGATGALPPTGGRGSAAVVAAVLLVISGLTVVLLTRRPTRPS